ncbi:MAG TPA: response regulator [Nitrospirae bacterium]|nr:response regulator [Nitrospirota bacterium]
MLHYNGMNEKILVLDDEPLILKTIERALAKTGYAVRIAREAGEFMRLLEEDPADLLLLDINLEGSRSDDLAGSIRDVAPKAKVIFMSGLIPSRDDIFFLEKPFTIEDLRILIRNVLDGTVTTGNSAGSTAGNSEE